VFDCILVSTSSTTYPTTVTPDDCPASFDAAVRMAALQQTSRLHEFGLRAPDGEDHAYRRLIDRLSA
jgi:hypothetical protein